MNVKIIINSCSKYELNFGDNPAGIAPYDQSAEAPLNRSAALAKSNREPAKIAQTASVVSEQPCKPSDSVSEMHEQT